MLSKYVKNIKNESTIIIFTPIFNPTLTLYTHCFVHGFQNKLSTNAKFFL
jgi:hypothetical protein